MPERCGSSNPRKKPAGVGSSPVALFAVAHGPMLAVLIDTDIPRVTLPEPGRSSQRNKKRAGNAVKHVVAS